MPIKKSSATLSSHAQVMNLLQKPETVVGAVVLLGMIVVGSSTWQQLGKQIASTMAMESVFPVTSKAPTLSLPTAMFAAQPSVVPTISPAATPAATASPSATAAPLASIEKLADTSAGTIVTALVNDTFWNIARRTCGRGVEGYRISQENGYRYKQLQPGDQILVICE